jgi:PAS domain S-box-containing protein
MDDLLTQDRLIAARAFSQVRRLLDCRIRGAGRQEIAALACLLVQELSSASGSAVYLSTDEHTYECLAASGVLPPPPNALAERTNETDLGGEPALYCDLCASWGPTGTLAVTQRAGSRLTPGEEAALRLLADCLALAVENQQLEERALRKEAEASFLTEVVHMIDDAADPIAALPAILQRAEDLTSEWFATALWDGADQPARFIATSVKGPNAEELSAALVDGSAWSSDLLSVGPVDVASAEALAPLAYLLRRYGLEGTLAPMAARGHVFGALIVGWSSPPDEQEVGLANAVAERIAVAVDTVRLFRLVERGKREWEATFDTLADGISIHDLQFNILRANRAFAALVGRIPQEVVGKKCHEIFHRSASPCVECPVARAIQGLPATSRVFQEPSVGECWLSASAYPLHSKDGEIFAFVHILRDITEERKLQETVVRTERMRALGEMATGVAHEFGNLLSSIGGWAEVLLAEDGDERLRRPATAIYQAAQDAAEAVRRIQDYARVRRGVAHTELDLVNLVQDALELARPRWRSVAARGRVVFDVETDLRPVPAIMGNATELREVLLNIIFNAVDAMPTGGTLSCRTYREDGWVSVRVGDTGEGMTEELRKKIFDPFFTTKGTAGSGLGLAISYGVVERHGGRITVESDPGRGSAFIISLPVACGSAGNGHDPQAIVMHGGNANG